MSRFFGYWLVLAPLAVVVTYATSLALFRRVDLTFAQFATLLTVPLAQAAALAWQAERPGHALAGMARGVVTHPLAQPVIALDLLVIGSGLLRWEQHLAGFGARVSIHTSWIVVKVVAATVFFAWAALRAGEGQRIALATHAVAPLLLALALEPSTSWMAGAFAQVRDVVGRRAEVLQRLVFFGALFPAVIALTLRAATQIERQSVVAARLLRVAVATAVPAATAVVLATFNLPVLTQPWRGYALLCASCCATMVLLAAVFTATAAEPPATGAKR